MTTDTLWQLFWFVQLISRTLYVFPSNLWREATHIKPLNNQVDLQQSKFSFEPFPLNSFPSENVNKQIYPDLLLYTTDKQEIINVDMHSREW